MTPYAVRLDLLNFLLADLRGGLGPYVGVFLLTQGWDQAAIGLTLTVSGLIGISLHAPIGALIDATHRKRGLLVAGILALSACAVAIPLSPTLPVVLAADTVMAVLGAVFAPVVAAITVGLVRREQLAPRLARNAAWDRTGNIFIAAVAGAVGWWLSLEAVFFLVPFFAVLTTMAALSIPAAAIDHERARGLDEVAPAAPHRPIGWRELLRYRPLLILALAIALFHFAHAPALMLLGQQASLARPGEVTVLMSAGIVTAQLVSIPAALLVGARADRWGRKPLLILGFAALPLRLLLHAASADPVWLIVGQILDGVSLGTIDALLALVLADLMRGTGRYNAARGLVGTVQGIGGSSSNAVAGVIVSLAGYPAAFATLAAIALAALLLLSWGLPETRPRAQD